VYSMVRQGRATPGQASRERRSARPDLLSPANIQVAIGKVKGVKKDGVVVVKR
jgi:hypothetical protein